MTEPAPIEVHKALADDTRYRLYRYLRLSGRPVSVRELSTRLSLHPNTLRPHLRRLEEAGLVASEARKGARVGRPQVLYTATDREAREGRDYRLLADILAGVSGTQRQRARAVERARGLGRLPRRTERPQAGGAPARGPEPGGAAGGAGGRGLRAEVPQAGRDDRGGYDLARMPLPGPPG